MEGPVRDGSADGVTLIETLRWEPAGGFRRLPAHLARMARGAAAFGRRFDRVAIDRALAGVAGPEALRVRLTLAPDGTARAVATSLTPGPAVWTVAVSGHRLRSDDARLRFKTDARGPYDAARAALPPGIDEALMLNERGEVCEGTITSVFVDLGAGLVTPPLACGLLPGVLRAEMLARGHCREAVLHPADLTRARLFVGNSLRGLIPARLAGAQA